MTTTRTARQVFEALSAGIGGGDWSALHLLYAEDAAVDVPFARPEPMRLRGREQVRAHFTGLAGRVSLTPHDVRVHETADPEVVVAEWDYESSAPSRAVGRGSAGVRFANIQVLRVRDGLIVESRDYHDHAAIAGILA